jgi:hypothetical protein
VLLFGLSAGVLATRYEHARILLGANVTRVLSVGTGRATD